MNISQQIGPKDPPVAVDWIAVRGVKSPDDLAQVDMASNRHYTYSQMNDRVGRVAAYLSSLGIKQGDRVGFLALNSTDVFELIFATWRIGAISLALNFRLTAPELTFIVNDAEPDVILVDQEFQQLAEELQQTTNVKKWLFTDGKGGDSPFEKVVAQAEPLLVKTIQQPLSEQCMLMYSSGTTGLPKGVIITHEMMLFSAFNFIGDCKLTSDSVILTFMPLFHIAGLNCFACPAFYLGATVFVQRSFDPRETLAAIGDAEMQVSHFLGVPAVFNALRAHPDNAKTDFSRVVLAIAGAEAVPEPLVRWWIERGLTIQEGFGMTESVASNCLIPKSMVAAKIGSAGKAVMHTEMKVMLEDGSEAGPDQLGELWMRGPCITPGYWNRPEANADSFVGEWFRSGDIVRCDKEGYYYIEDRLKDMYISGGENVYPAEIENVLYAMDQIAEVAVIGVSDSKWGEVGCAVVAPTDDAEITLADISDFVSDKLAKYKQPVHLVIVDVLPRTATGKVLKFELRKSIPSMLKLN